MQVKVIGIPVAGSEAMEEVLNTFLRTHKIIQVEHRLVEEPQGAVWSFCIRYLEGGVKHFITANTSTDAPGE